MSHETIYRRCPISRTFRVRDHYASCATGLSVLPDDMWCGPILYFCRCNIGEGVCHDAFNSSRKGNTFH